MFLCPVSRGAVAPRTPEGLTPTRSPTLQGGEKDAMPFMPFAIFGTLVPGAPRPGACWGWDLAPRHLVRRATASRPRWCRRPPTARAPRPGRCPSESVWPAGVPVFLGDGRLGGRPPAGAGGERRRAVGRPPPVAGRAAGACPPQAPTVEHLPGPDGTTLHLEIYGPPEAPPLLVTHGWGVTSAQWYYLLQDVGDAVPPRRVGFTGPGPLDAPCTVRV